ncbi:hypothetical protein ASD76_14015 [Altererythrobacter sp. Root672]|nr:hypothetical protein [Altererythrobacter sp. Root672]KRA81634.1 hypothetical protein ASD76_14015 [Altererythrobacter sp. Root672]
MCNLYRMTKTTAEVANLFNAVELGASNAPAEIYPGSLLGQSFRSWEDARANFFCHDFEPTAFGYSKIDFEFSRLLENDRYRWRNDDYRIVRISHLDGTRNTARAPR